MARRRLSVFDYRQIVVLLRAGESARSIASRGLAGRNKVKKVRRKAQSLGWLDSGRPTPAEEEVAEVFARELTPPVPRQESLVERYRDQVQAWVEEVSRPPPSGAPSSGSTSSAGATARS
jgi:hypothetical protein